MRCLIRLKSLKNQEYNPSYYVKLQGVLYNLLEETEYDDIHNLKPFKFICFSNIFPPKDMSKGDERTWIISSPSQKLVEALGEVISDKDKIESGNQQYQVESFDIFGLNPGEKGTMITGTPIIVRIPADECEKYGIDSDGYDDVYWRLNHNPEAFLDKVENNLASKYSNYYDREPPERPYFTGYEPRKQVSVPLEYSDGDVVVIGTTWKFHYECESREMRRLIRIGFSSGLGELNTTGFGFMNKVGDN